MRLLNISKSYGERKIFSNFNFEIEEGKITSVMGPSGCGKTTLLNIITNLTGYEGVIMDAPAKISYVFQDLRLLPNLTVWQNLEFVLMSIESDKKLRASKIEEVLSLVELSDRRNDYPKSLSGGMAQRVAMARAFVYPAKLILMDEPFKGLDLSLKKRLTSAFLKLWEHDKKTVLAVSHDLDDALLIADRTVIFNADAEIIYDKALEFPKNGRDLAMPELTEIKREIYKLI